LGRTNVIHAALGAGEASAAFLYRVRRLAAYRSNGTVDPPVVTATDDGGAPSIETEPTNGPNPGAWKDA